MDMGRPSSQISAFKHVFMISASIGPECIHAESSFPLVTSNNLQHGDHAAPSELE